MLKITNTGKSRRRLIDRGNWVHLEPKESVLMERVDPSQEFIKDSKAFKIEEVDDKKKKGGN